MTYDLALQALADPTRRAVFECLSRRPLAVGELARRFPVSRPAISQHLKILKSAGLVSERRDGTRNIYSVYQPGLAELRAYLDRFWDQSLDNYRSFVTTKEKEKL